MHPMHAWVDLLDEARAAGLAGERSRARWLQQQAIESATLIGTLVDLAESSVGVALAVVGGRRHDGRIVAIGSDVLALADRDAIVLVRFGAVAAVRPVPGAAVGAATGDRPAALDVGLAEVLGRIAPERPEVALALANGDAITGELIAAGVDVLTVRVAPGDGIVYCSTTSLSSVRFRSG